MIEMHILRFSKPNKHLLRILILKDWHEGRDYILLISKAPYNRAAMNTSTEL